MTIEEIKKEILEIKKKWDAIGESSDNSSGAYFDDLKEAEMYEIDISTLIWEYCEGQGYEVEGFPFQKRKLAETNDDYDEDYFCHERYLKYIDILATTHDDVQELMWFYQTTFAPEFYNTKKDFINALKNDLKHNKTHNIDF